MASSKTVSDEATTSPRLRKKMSFKTKLLMTVGALLMMGILRNGFMFVIIAMLPTIVASFFDITTQRYTFKTILAANLCGLLPYLGRMLKQGPSSAVLQSIMGDASSWVAIYGAAFIGWLLIQVCPIIAQVMMRGFYQTQIAHIERTQKKIESEWGPEVTQFSREEEEEEEE